MHPAIPTDTSSRSRWDIGLEIVSELILEEKRKLVPHIYSLPKHDSVRSDNLWRKYTRSGIFMSNGGVGKSFLSGADVRRGSAIIQRNLDEYNLYRSDRPESTALPQDKIKQFLVDDGLISAASDREKIAVEFSLGSHEAFTRLLRCIRHDEKNTGLLYPVGGYGLLVRAAATVETGKYDVCLVQADREHGEKILLSSLEKEAARHPRAKTLYLESKTMCGAIYSREELSEIVKFCKKKHIFLILDSAHANMEFTPENKFPDLVSICQEQGYDQYAEIFTGSKTYGLERGRVGFIILGDKGLAVRLYKEFFKVIGSMSDGPIELVSALISSEPEERQRFRDERLKYHEYNMNLLITYVEGIESSNVDPRMKEELKKEIPLEYQNGVEGMKLIYRPDGGIQLKVDMSGLCQKYFGNIRMFNSEIFSYALHAATDVVTLHSYQLMDEVGNAMRLSFSIREDVHQGMRLMHDFVREALKDHPSPNPYMPGVELVEDFIFPTEVEIDKFVADSRIKAEEMRSEGERLRRKYLGNAKSRVAPLYRKRIKKDVADEAATVIQEKWRETKREWLAALEVEGVAVGSELPRVTSLASLAKAGGAGAAAVDASSPARVKSSASGGDSSPARPSSVRPSRRPMSATRVTPSWSPARGGGVTIVEKESQPEADVAQESSGHEDDHGIVLEGPPKGPSRRRISQPKAEWAVAGVAPDPAFVASPASIVKILPPPSPLTVSRDGKNVRGRRLQSSPMRSDDGREL